MTSELATDKGKLAVMLGRKATAPMKIGGLRCQREKTLKIAFRVFLVRPKLTELEANVSLMAELNISPSKNCWGFLITVNTAVKGENEKLK